MKRILAITLTLIMLLVALTGCIASQNQPISGADLFSQKKIQTITFSSDPNGYQYSFNGSAVQKICDFFSSLSFTIDESPDPSDVTGMGWDMTISYEDEHSETIVFPPNRTYLLKNSTKYKLTSNAVIEIDALIDELKENQTYHSSCLLTIAETLPSCVAFEYKDEKPYCFYAYDTEGHLYRVIWDDFTGLNEKDVVVVDHNDDIKKLDYVNPPGGWTPQYEVTATGIKMEKRANDYLALHIQIKSGANTIHPFGSLLWSETDHGDGFVDVMHADYVEITDMVKRCADVIPKLVLDESVSYLVQVNGRVENVYLLTPNGDTYAKSETTFDALSNLEDGTYYVAFEVLLSGNCDPDTPQNSSRYQDIFCLVVGEDDKPATSDMITYSSGDVLSQTVLNNDEKQVIINILNSDKEWISEIPECTYICRFSGSVNVGYCDCGTLSDIGNNRSRKLTDVERESIESLISQLNEEPTHSGYEVEVELFQYTWDGWGISTKTVGACDVAYNIIDALKAMKETGETVPKISDEVFEIGGGQYAAERGTMWIESGNKIYRLTPDLSQICLVETPFGEGKVLEITDAFKTNVNNAWHYAPYDYYKGTYNKGDYTVNLTSVFKSGSTVQLSIKKIQIESGFDPNNTITVELISSVDQEVNIKLHCQQSDDNLAAGDYRTVQLKKGEPTTVDLTFGGWPNFTYWVYIEADYTKAEITINP